tara:strand:+ start:661 stop:1284 length:624 start_codon:yes stop_codon:yes gene_type:complete
MALQTVWFPSRLPEKLVDLIEEDLNYNFGEDFMDSRLAGDSINRRKRNSTNAWVDSNHWVCGVIWHYISCANNYNFQFDLTSIDGNAVQYTKYNAGEYYGWHSDMWLEAMVAKENTNPDNLDGEMRDYLAPRAQNIRKLSCIIQLSDSSDYEGGNVQMMDDTEQSYFLPRERGTVAVFDSRARHRVQKVTSGTRKSLVAWAVGPRWR